MANDLKKKKKKQSEGNEQPKLAERKHPQYTKEHVWSVIKKWCN